MANFIEKTLEPGEQVILKGRMHWTYNVRYTLTGVVLLLLCVGMGVSVLLSGEGSVEESSTLFVFIAIVAVCSVLLIWFGYFMRSRTEFAVTTSRFIQKDGILNIKMTEIPLFKIETVNFYQTLVERICGTGSIELVGSGGTNHRVEYVQHPYEVRNQIAMLMKEQPHAQQ